MMCLYYVCLLYYVEIHTSIELTLQDHIVQDGRGGFMVISTARHTILTRLLFAQDRAYTRSIISLVQF